jgi:hypothetical protein
MVGLHGTSKTNAISICANGFNIDQGVRGKGVYFWKIGPYAMELAYASYQKKLDNNDFRHQTDSGFSVINSRLDTEEDSFLDFTKPDNRIKLENYVQQMMAKRPKIAGEKRKEYIRKIYDLFIHELQKVANCIIKLIMVFVPNPYPGPCGYPVDILGHPICLVAKDISCIQSSTRIEGLRK